MNLQLRDLAREIDQRLGTREPSELLSVSQSRGVVPRSELTDKEPRADSHEKYKCVVEDDIVLNRFNAYRGALGRVRKAGMVSPDYAVIRPSFGHSKFITYWLQSDRIAQAMKSNMGGLGSSDPDSSSFSRIDIKSLMRQEIEEVGSESFRAIASFLDRETAQIDALIDKQQQLIETLAERRKAVITRAVTRGLDPTVELKDTDIAVLSQIPKHWAVVQLKRFLDRIEQGVSPEAGSELADQESWGVLKAGCVNRGYFSDKEHKRLPDDFEFKLSLAVSAGDLLVNRASGSPSLVGSAAIVRAIRYNLILSDKIFRLVVKPQFSSAFLEHVLQSMLYRTQVLQSISGAEGLANNLPSSSLKGFWVPAPPLVEQKSIAKWLDVEAKKVDDLISKARQVIEVLKERRQALISAAVTGKIDVRGIA